MRNQNSSLPPQGSPFMAEMKRIENGQDETMEISVDQPSSLEKCVKQEVEVGILN